jgi:hypothetical protein
MDIYSDFQEAHSSWFWDSAMAVIEIETDRGVVGRGRGERYEISTLSAREKGRVMHDSP